MKRALRFRRVSTAREVAAMVEALPEEMLSRFDEAIRLSDVDEIEKGIEAIGGINPRLGRFLKNSPMSLPMTRSPVAWMRNNEALFSTADSAA